MIAPACISDPGDKLSQADWLAISEADIGAAEIPYHRCLPHSDEPKWRKCDALTAPSPRR
jgi:hypothetical protein